MLTYTCNLRLHFEALIKIDLSLPLMEIRIKLSSVSVFRELGKSVFILFIAEKALSQSVVDIIYVNKMSPYSNSNYVYLIRIVQ